MPWKECHIVDEHPRFIARLLDGEKMAGLCREFGISRKTGYKIYTRYKDCGLDGLTDARLGGTDFLTMLRNAEIVDGRGFACPRSLRWHRRWGCENGDRESRDGTN